MSAPVQNDKRLDDPRLYAPPWARERPLPAVAQPQLISSPPVASAPETPAATDDPEIPFEEPLPPKVVRMPRGVGGPNLEWAPKFAPQAPPQFPPQAPPQFSPQPEFDGDVAIRALRRRLSLEPDVVPEPPAIMRAPTFPWIARLGFVFFAAAAVAFGVVVVTSPEGNRSIPTKGDRIVLTSAELTSAKPSAPSVDDPARLVVEVTQVAANEPLPLGVSLHGAAGDESVHFTGLATGTRLTAGSPFGNKGWRIAARDLGAVFAYAPRDYVGVMDTAIHLRSAGNALLDSQTVRLEWKAKEAAQLAPVPTPRAQAPLVQLDRDEIAMLVKRGQQFIQTGDIAAARLMFRRAADAGDASAALAMGATYDPTVLRQMGVLGFAPDVEQARAWYQKAAALGASEAPRLVERLQASRQ